MANVENDCVTPSQAAKIGAASLAICGASLTTTLGYTTSAFGPGYPREWTLGGVVVLALFLGSWTRRQAVPALLAIATLIAASLGSHFLPLSLAVVGLVFLLTAGSRGPRWLGLAAGSLGSLVSEVIFTDGFSAPIVATLLGSGAAQLVYYRDGNLRLRNESNALRDQQALLMQRTALARELHDAVGHQVTAIVLQAEAGLVGDERVALNHIATAGRSALGELDRLVMHLRDPASLLPVTVTPQLRDIDEVLAESFRRAGLRVDVALDPGVGLNDATVLAVYRIAQEGLTNASRHAHARSVEVDISRDRNTIRLRIADDGRGPPTVVTRGMGLAGIRERIAPYDGTMRLVARPGEQGAVLEVSMEVGEL